MVSESQFQKVAIANHAADFKFFTTIFNRTNGTLGPMEMIYKFSTATIKYLLIATLAFILVSHFNASIMAQTVTKQLYLSDPAQALDRVHPGMISPVDLTTASSAYLSTSSVIALDNISQTSAGNVISVSVSHTTGTGINRLMLVGVSFQARNVNDEISSVTYGGVPLVRVGIQKNATNPDRGQVEIYSLVNPNSGNANVVVTFGEAVNEGVVLGVVTYTGVHQTSTFGPFAGSSGTSINPSLTGIVSATGEVVFDVLYGRRTASAVPGAGQTELWDIRSSGQSQGSASIKSGAATVSTSWTMDGSDTWAMGAVSIKPAPIITTATFTQSPALCSSLTIKAGAISVTNFVTIGSGTMPANPNITAVLKYGATTIATLINPVYNSGTGLLTWTGALGADITVPAGQAIVLEITTAQAGVAFTINYDSQSKPSKIELLTSTYIDITSYAVYNAPYPGGSIITASAPGTTVYLRAVVTDPFGFDDITGLSINISGSPVTATSVATAACTRTYEYTWVTPATGGTYAIPATAFEGYENTVTSVKALSFDLCSPTIGLPVFTLGATSTRCQSGGNVTYSATSTNSTGITYSLDAASLAAGLTINAATGQVSYIPGWSGSTIITASAAGCGGPRTSTHTVTITPTVGSPVFALGATSSRCQGAGTETYTATASNSTGITYSLDAASLGAGNTINPTTGQVTYVAGWVSSSVITASAAGCSGPATATHVATCISSVTTPVFALGATTTRCQAAGSVTYLAAASFSTGMTYSLDAASIAAGNTINSTTGAVTYVAGWYGTTTITASAAGCNGPKTSAHSVTITPDGTPAFVLGSVSARPNGAGSVTYTAIASNGATVTYSLDATSIAAGNTINSSTGAVTYTAAWLGTSTITATVSGCAGNKSSTHTAQTKIFKQLYLSDPGLSLDRIDPVATGDATTSQTSLLGYGITSFSADLIAEKDNYVMQKSPANNFGSCSSLVIDRESTDLQRALFQFDLSSIPAGASITSAELKLFSTNIGGLLNISVFPLGATEYWNEGTECGSAGQSNWTQRTSTSNWDNIGVIGDPGIGTPAATINTSSTGLHTWTVTSTGSKLDFRHHQ